MKKGKIIFGTMIMTGMAVITGCSSKPTASSLLSDMQKSTESLKSTEMNMDMTMSMTMQGVSMDIAMNMDIQNTTDPIAAYSTGKIDVLGQSMDMQSYTIFEEDKAVNYVYTMGTWIKQEIGVDMAQSEDLSKQIQTMIAASDNITLAEETEKVDDKDVYVLTMSLAGKDILEMMNGAESMITSVAGSSETSDALADIDYSVLSADITYGIDKVTKLPVYLNMTIDGMSSLYANVDGMEEVEIAPIDLKTKYTGFDTVDTITVPQDVIDSAVDIESLNKTE